MSTENETKKDSGVNALGRLRKSIFIIAFIVIPLIVLYGLYAKKSKEKEENIGQQNVQMMQTEKGYAHKVIDTDDLVRYKVKAVGGRRVLIGSPSGYKRMRCYWDPDYESLGNKNRLYEIRLNENDNFIKTEGLLPNGKMTLASFKKPAQRIELKSLCILSDKSGSSILDEYNRATYLPVYLIVEYTK